MKVKKNQYMKRILIIYPIIFAINYFLLKNIPVPDVLWLSGLLFLVSTIIFMAINRWIKNAHRAWFITILGLGWALYFGAAAHVFLNILQLKASLPLYIIFLLPWTAGFLFAGSSWLWRKLPILNKITIFMNIFTIMTFLYFGFTLYLAETHAYIGKLDSKESSIISPPPVSTRPDIYYIILDGYGRADALEEIYGYDNSAFIDFLSSRGFYMASQSQSNYIHTAISLTSSLNMSYYQGFPDFQIRYPIFQRLISESQARIFLKKQGYRFVSFATPTYFSNIPDADTFLTFSKVDSHSAYLESQIMPGSLAAIPLEAGLISPGGQSYRDFQLQVVDTFDKLGNLPTLPGQKFVFAHIMLPHPPYVFNQNGPITPDKPYILMGFTNSAESRIEYINQLIYLNSLLEKAIDAILKSSPTPPVIILQGDHGPGTYFTSKSKDLTCLKERVSILNAYYLPGFDHNLLYTTITPVNTFRLVFNQYFGTQFNLLVDKTYYSSFEGGNIFSDVTEESNQACRLP
jgi:hypothetical protein